MICLGPRLWIQWHAPVATILITTPHHSQGAQAGMSINLGQSALQMQKQMWKAIGSIFFRTWSEIYQYSWNPWPAVHFCQFPQEQGGIGETYGLNSLHDSHQATGKRNVLRGGKNWQTKGTTAFALCKIYPRAEIWKMEKRGKVIHVVTISIQALLIFWNISFYPFSRRWVF